MDEVNLIIDILDTNWTSSATALESLGYISSSHTGKPNLIDVRSLEKNKGVRYDLSSKDVIIVFEDSQNLEYPTIHFDLRNETYGFTLHIRTVHDERAGTDAAFGRDRLRALHLRARGVAIPHLMDQSLIRFSSVQEVSQTTVLKDYLDIN